MYGATFGFPIERNKIFSFTSFEQWDDRRPLSIVRTVPTEAERRGDFSQSVLNGRVRTIYNPFTSTSIRRRGSSSASRSRAIVIPSTLFDPAALQDAERHTAAQSAGQRRQLAGQRLRHHRLLESLAARRRELHRRLEDVRPLRTVQGEPVSAESDRRAASSRCPAATATA